MSIFCRFWIEERYHANQTFYLDCFYILNAVDNVFQIHYIKNITKNYLVYVY